ncbi:MAG: diadenylate cyclase CdaA [Phycisphaeraceae bacterium]
MEYFDRLIQLFHRVQGYLYNEPLQVLIELAVIWVVIYVILRFLRGTRGARVIKGLAVILIVFTLAIQVLGRESAFERLNFLYSNFLAFASLMLVIVFQPELRRALVRLGEARFFRQSGLRKARVVEEVLGAVQYLSRNKIGALMAIERQVGLQGIVELGIRLDAEVSKEVINTIFWPGSALHDMGMVIRGDRIVAAGVQFPLAEGENIPQELGSRHRAALGLSQEADALVIVVSEETGTVSLAERGELQRGVTVDELRPILTRGMGNVPLSERTEESMEAAQDTSSMTTSDEKLGA